MRQIFLAILIFMMMASGWASAQTLADADNAAAAAARETADDDLASYMDRLAQVQSRWQEAAQLLHDGKKAAAVELLGEFPYGGMNERWRDQQQSLATDLKGIKPDRKTPPWDRPPLGRWYAEAEASALAIEAFEKDIQAGRILSFHNRCSYALCLIEVCRFTDARAALAEALKSPDVESDWRQSVEIRLKALDGLADGQPPPLDFYRKFYTQYATSMDARRLSAYLAVWRMVQVDPQSGENLAVLATLFNNIGDSVAERLTLLWTASHLPAGSPAAAEALLGLANSDYEAKRIDEAIARWRAVETEYPNTSAWGKAVFNIGLALKDQSRYREAIAQFSKMFAAQVDDREPGGSIMEAYRNYRANAQWEIGHCFFALGDYGAALDAYRTTQEKYPFQSWCGTCSAGYQREYAFRQGLCRDFLGDTAGALKDYWQVAFLLEGTDIAVVRRIADLYEGARKLDVLQHLLDETDRYTILRWQREAGKVVKEIDPKVLDRVRPTRAIRRLLEIRDLAQRGEMEQLVALLKAKGTVASPGKADTRRSEWEAAEAARLLAQQPDMAVPLLKARLLEPRDNSTKWVFWTLGLCGTNEALEALRALVPDPYLERDIVCAIAAGGENGQRALEELEKASVAVQYIASYREGTLVQPDIEFPPVPKDAKVPERLAELDDFTRYRESLPEKVEVDLSTPEATIRTFMTATAAQAWDAFAKCTDGNAKWKGMYEDLARQSFKDPIRYELGPPSYPAADAAEVPVVLFTTKHRESGIFTLAKRNGFWIVTGIKSGRDVSKSAGSKP
jgi:tetratricopeptide (TPR) repeat protein